MKLKVGNVDIECTVQEAVELLAQLRERRIDVPYEGQPGWVIVVPPAFKPPYEITCGSTDDKWTRIINPTVGDRPYISSTSGGNIKGMV